MIPQAMAKEGPVPTENDYAFNCASFVVNTSAVSIEAISHNLRVGINMANFSIGTFSVLRTSIEQGAEIDPLVVKGNGSVEDLTNLFNALCETILRSGSVIKLHLDLSIDPLLPIS